MKDASMVLAPLVELARAVIPEGSTAWLLDPGEDPDGEGLPQRSSRTPFAYDIDDTSVPGTLRGWYRERTPGTRAQSCFRVGCEVVPAVSPRCPVLVVDRPTPGPLPAEVRAWLDLATRLFGVSYAAPLLRERIAEAANEPDAQWAQRGLLDVLAAFSTEDHAWRAMSDAEPLLEAIGLTYWSCDRFASSLVRPIWSRGCPLAWRESRPPGRWGVIAHVFKTGAPEFADDTDVNPEFRRSRFAREHGIRSAAAVPGRVGQQDASGVLFVNRGLAGDFTPAQRMLAAALASGVASSIDLRDRARERRLEVSFRSEAVGADRSSPTALETLRQAMFRRLVGAVERPAALFTADPVTRGFVRYDENEAGRRLRGRLDHDHPVSRSAATLRDDYVVLDLPDPAAAPPEGRCVAVPLLDHGRVEGWLVVPEDAEPFGMEDPALGDLAMLLGVERIANQGRRHLLGLARFLRIYEYVGDTQDHDRLLTAFLDALLLSTPADVVSLYVPRKPEGGWERLCCRGSIGGLDLPAVATVGDSLDHACAGDVGVIQRDQPRPGVRSDFMLPLRVDGEHVGCLRIEHQVDHPHDDDEEWFLRTVAHQLGQSLRNRERHRALIERIGHISEAGQLVAATGASGGGLWEDERQRLIDALASHASKLTRSDTVTVWVNTGEGLTLAHITPASTRYVLGMRPPEKGLTGAAIAERRAVRVADVNADPRYVRETDAIRSELVVPILDQQRVVAVVDLESKSYDRYRESDVEFVTAMGLSLLTLERTIQLQIERARHEVEAKVLAEINSLAANAAMEGRRSVLAQIVRVLHHHTGVGCVQVNVVDRAGETFPAREAVDHPPGKVARSRSVADSIIGWTLSRWRMGGPRDLWLPDVRQTPPGCPAYVAPTQGAFTAELVVAIGSPTNTIAVLNVEDRGSERIERHLGLFRHAATAISNAIALSDMLDGKAGAAILSRVEQGAKDLFEALASTVFHDGPQQLDAVLTAHVRIRDAYEALREGATLEQRNSFESAWQQKDAAFEVLDRLLRLLPKDAHPVRFDLAEEVRRILDPQQLVGVPRWSKLVRPDLKVVDDNTCRVEVMASKAFLELILRNVLSNSARSMSLGGVERPEVVVTVERIDGDGLARVRVRDNGPGMPADVAEQLGQKRIGTAGQAGKDLGVFCLLAGQHLRSGGGDFRVTENKPGRVEVSLTWRLWNEDGGPNMVASTDAGSRDD